MENAELFVDCGGDKLDYIPALNDEPAHVQALSDIIAQHVDGWPALQVGGDGKRMQRAQQLADEFSYRLPPALKTDPSAAAAIPAEAPSKAEQTTAATVADEAIDTSPQSTDESRKVGHG